jgi:hypothetical protein
MNMLGTKARGLLVTHSTAQNDYKRFDDIPKIPTHGWLTALYSYASIFSTYPIYYHHDPNDRIVS